MLGVDNCIVLWGFQNEGTEGHGPDLTIKIPKPANSNGIADPPTNNGNSAYHRRVKYQID